MATATRDQSWDDRARRDGVVRAVIATVVLLAAVGAVVYASTWAWRELRPADPATAAVQAPLPATPEAAVQAYLAAVTAGDGPAARRLVVPASAPRLLEGIGSDLGNIERLVNLSVGKPVPVPAAAGAAATPAPASAASVVVPVTYGVVYRNQISGDNGGTRRWYVLEQQPSGGWLVLQVRTTP